MLAYKQVIFQVPNRQQKCYRRLGAYLIIMLVYRRLLTKHLHGKAAVLQQIMFEKFEKQRNLFVQDYNNTNYITYASQGFV